MKCKDCESKGCPYRNTFNNGICVYNPEKSIIFDWQFFRAEAAKDILRCMVKRGVYGEDRTIAHQSELAVRYADNLISKLKEKEEK